MYLWRNYWKTTTISGSTDHAVGKTTTTDGTTKNSSEQNGTHKNSAQDGADLHHVNQNNDRRSGDKPTADRVYNENGVLLKVRGAGKWANSDYAPLEDEEESSDGEQES